MTKLEIIEKAYGDNWNRVKDHVSENGYIQYKVIAHGVTNELHYEDDFNYTDIQVDVIQDYGHGQFLWRPKELKGIDNNNGWIKIFDEDNINLPTKGGKYEVVFNNTRIGDAIYVRLNRWYTVYNNNLIPTDTVGITHFRHPIRHELPVY